MRPHFHAQLSKEVQMETKIKVVTFNNLSKAIENIEKIYATKNIENKIVDTKVSKEQPSDQSIGDIWFVEQERN